MARRTSTRTTKAAPAESDLQVTPEVGKIENKASEPANIETTTPSEEPVAAAPAPTPAQLQTDFREKLTTKSLEENVFVPSNPAALEKAASAVAQQNGFDLNRGTSIGARLMARANKSI